VNFDRSTYQPGAREAAMRAARTTGFTHVGPDGTAHQWLLEQFRIHPALDGYVTLRWYADLNDFTNFTFPVRLDVDGYQPISASPDDDSLLATAQQMLNSLELTAFALASTGVQHQRRVAHARPLRKSTRHEAAGPYQTAAHVFTLTDPTTRALALNIVKAPGYRGTFEELLTALAGALHPADAALCSSRPVKGLHHRDRSARSPV
jgi:hypothetical protein